jgi:hypothetical protein
MSFRVFAGITQLKIYFPSLYSSLAEQVAKIMESSMT